MLLHAEKIGFRFAETPLLDGLSLRLLAGEHLALVGPNGCGKSTLIKILTQSLEADSGQVSFGKDVEILALDQVASPTQDQSVRDYLAGGLVHWQQLKATYEGALEQLQDEPENEEALRTFGEAESDFGLHGGYAYPARIDSALNALGLAQLADHQAARLSGGQRHRCRLARLLLTPADLWILDEPTNHLDDEGINWLVQLLSNCRHAWLVISHDRHLLEHCPDSIGELDHGRIERYPGAYSAYLLERAQRRETMQNELAAYQEEARRLKDFVAKYKAGQKSKQASARAKALERLERPPEPPTQRGSLPITFGHVPRSADEVLVIKGLSAGYEQPLVKPFEALIRRGERIVIKGSNGCGKTTLLRTLLGELEPLSGDVRFGVKVRPAMLGQQLEAVLGDQTAGTWLEAQVPVQRIQQARNLAGGLGLNRLALQRSCNQLSGGERTRLALASLLLRDLNLLVLDEPTNHLDLRAREGLEDALSRYPGTLFVVSHDRAFCQRIATRWWRIDEGSLLEADDAPAEQGTASKPAAKPKGAILKEQQKKRRRLESQTQKKERLVDELGASIKAIDEQLIDPELQSDWNQLEAIEQEREGLLEQQMQAEQDWLELCDELEAFDEALPKA